MKPGWTCGSWRPNWGNATSPTRATTVAGKCLPRRTLCRTRLTWSRLPRRRPPMTRRAERTPTSSASQRESASSDRRRTNGLALGQEALGALETVVKKYFESNRKKHLECFYLFLFYYFHPKQLKLLSRSMKSSNLSHVPAAMKNSVATLAEKSLVNSEMTCYLN